MFGCLLYLIPETHYYYIVIYKYLILYILKTPSTMITPADM